jgi:hypothetical protein
MHSGDFIVWWRKIRIEQCFNAGKNCCSLLFFFIIVAGICVDNPFEGFIDKLEVIGAAMPSKLDLPIVKEHVANVYNRRPWFQKN